jgi:hypothetical protein
MSDRYRVLAVEPDATCGRNLIRLIQQAVNASVVVVSSGDAAVRALSSRLPDAVLVSALLPPNAEADVMRQLARADPGRKVPVLIVPPALEPPAAEEPPRRFRLIRRRSSATPRPLYDAPALAERIVAALSQSRNEPPATTPAAVAVGTAPPASLADAVTALESREGSAPSPLQPSIVASRPRSPQHRAPRLTPAQLPWPCLVTLRGNDDIIVRNISSTGVLIESSNKFKPGSVTEFQVAGPGSPLLVAARFVRSEVAAVGPRGVRYETAAMFSRQLDLLGGARPAPSASAPRALAELLVRVSRELGAGAPPDRLRAAFEEGMRQLVPACEIGLRREPAAPEEGCDAIYFTVPAAGAGERVLQATFASGYEPSADEFNLLRAAAAVAVVIVQYEGGSRQRSV